MRILCAVAIAFSTFHSSYAQTKQQIIDDLKARTTTANSDTTLLVTTEGLNVFFARKIAYYLSGVNDLSLYKNYAILNSTDGKLFIGHNVVKENSAQRKISLLTVGISTTVKEGFSSIFSNNEF